LVTRLHNWQLSSLRAGTHSVLLLMSQVYFERSLTSFE
jgi:hypothetical protein